MTAYYLKTLAQISLLYVKYCEYERSGAKNAIWETQRQFLRHVTVILADNFVEWRSKRGKMTVIQNRTIKL